MVGFEAKFEWSCLVMALSHYIVSVYLVQLSFLVLQCVPSFQFAILVQECSVPVHPCN